MSANPLPVPNSPYPLLVTGGAGFIGSHIVDAFLAAGHPVAVIDNLSTGKRENLNPAARFYEADIRDRAALDHIMAAERPVAISHQAALCDLRGSLVDPVGYADVNIGGTLALLEAARGSGTVRKIIFASTGGAVYGNPEELPASERCSTRPLDPYGVTKLACENFLATYKHNYDLEYCALRYANVFGPRQNSYGEAGVVAIFAAAMLSGRALTIHGDGRQSRDFVFVADVAAANVAALSYGNGVYNIGTGLPTDINTIFAELSRLTGYTGAEVHGPAKLGEARHNYLDAYKARCELGWDPQVHLREGLKETVNSIKLRMDG